MALGTAWLVAWIIRSAEVVAENSAELNRLDREIGDGDHGENMERGFSAAADRVRELPPESSPAEVLKLVATTLISNVGGASGPLYGTAFLRASVAVADNAELDGSALAALLEAARDGIVSRGKAEVGDKTMVDAWAPAAQAALDASGDGETEAAILHAAAVAADRGSKSTDELVARKGRASYLGERAIGHRDPGSVSTTLLLRAAADTAQS